MCVVLKFGGSSVSNAEKIKKVAKRIYEISKKEKCVVVVSAMGNTTDKYLALAKKVCGKNEINKTLLDELLNLGELKSVYLLCLALCDFNIKVVGLNGNEAGIVTCGAHGNSSILKVNKQRLEAELIKNDVVVVAGFCGENERHEICTLGRGGSDTSAVALAAMLKCKCIIYSDVNGIYSIDPKVYKKAKKLNKINVDDMLELSAFGAKVLEGRCVEIAKQKNVDLVLANSSNKIKGTEIVNKPFESLMVTGATILNYAFLKIKVNYNEFEMLLNLLYDNEIKPLSCNFKYEDNVCLVNIACTHDKVQKFIKSSEKLAKNIEFYPNLNMITIVGNGFCNYFQELYKVIIKLINSNIKIFYLNLCDRVCNIWVEKECILSAIELISKEFNL